MPYFDHEKLDCYQVALQAGEVARALEVAGKLRVANAGKCNQARELLLRVSAMLWPLTKS